MVAAQSKNKCFVRFLYLFAGIKRKSLIKDFLEKEAGSPFAFSEVVSEELDLLQAIQDGLMDPELQVSLLAEIEEGVHHFMLISPSHGQPHGATSLSKYSPSLGLSLVQSEG